MLPIKSSISAVFAAASFFLTGSSNASANPCPKEKAEIVVSAVLAPTDPTFAASGATSLELCRTNGSETLSAMRVSVAGLQDGTYTLTATRASDDMVQDLGTITVASTVARAELSLPQNFDTTDIAALGVVSEARVVVLSGMPELKIVQWTFAANAKTTAPELTAAFAGGKKSKIKKMHGHVLVHTRIVNGLETRRKFLLVAHNGPPNTMLTINIDGVAAGTLLTTGKGKIMARSLPGEISLAGIETMTLTDAAGVVVAEASFVPVP